MYDDLDTGILSRMDGCWVSDRGQHWYGVDPEEWVRQCERRMERQRRWMERQRRDRAEVARCRLLRKGLKQKMPGPLVEVALQHAFGWAAV